MKRHFLAALLAAVMPIAALSAAAPDYLVVRLTRDVAATPDAAWAKIGDYCFLGMILKVSCDYVAGTGDVGTIRRLNGVTLEPQVARTPYSYTYSQIEGGRKDTDYHGTLAVEPAGPRRARLVYTLLLDQARLPADTDRAAMRTQLAARFQGVLDQMKLVIEAGR